MKSPGLQRDFERSLEAHGEGIEDYQRDATPCCRKAPKPPIKKPGYSPLKSWPKPVDNGKTGQIAGHLNLLIGPAQTDVATQQCNVEA